MNCLQNLPRSSVFPVQSFKSCAKIPPCYVNILGVKKATDLHRSYSVKVTSGSAPSTNMEGVKVEEEKSEIYSSNMTEAMGAVLTYRHELGMNYNFIRPDLIVGSCLQTPEDVDRLRIIGVKTIFCLQQDSDLEYFGVDIAAIREYANTFDDIQHLRAKIRDFDAFDLRSRLPAVVSKLYKAINRNGGVTYIHCTAGLGRAPATALAYMFWVQGYKLSEALNLLLSKRPCFPKLDAIKSATADMLTGLKKKPVTLSWNGDNCSTVEISGLDIGWGQKIPLTYDEEEGLWVLHRELPEGRYEYKYIVDGKWLHNKDELVNPINKDGHINNYVQLTGLKKKPVTLSWNGDNCSKVEISGLDIGWGQKIPLRYDDEEGLWVLHRELPEGRYEYKYIVDGKWLHNKDEPVNPINKDGHINNYVQVSNDNPDSIAAALRKRLTSNNPYFTKNERLIIRQFLEACPDDE